MGAVVLKTGSMIGIRFLIIVSLGIVASGTPARLGINQIAEGHQKITVGGPMAGIKCEENCGGTGPCQWCGTGAFQGMCCKPNDEGNGCDSNFTTWVMMAFGGHCRSRCWPGMPCGCPAEDDRICVALVDKRWYEVHGLNQTTTTTPRPGRWR